jgi:outer membrane protein OmpA-like peptidoglycan-associated protein
MIVGLFAAMPTFAERCIRDLGDDITPESFIAAMKGCTSADRSLRRPTLPLEEEPSTLEQLGLAPAIVVRAEFAFGSSILTTEGKEQLQAVAEVLSNSEMEADVWLIEGHTDSVGSETSNLRLSERRARAAKSYLVKLGVDAARLAIVGRGESMPLPDEPHDSQKQRRIQMRNLGQ